MKMKITDEVFEFVENDTAETADLYSIRIKKGRFKNVIFTYGRVRFNEDTENNQLKFNFSFHINEGNNRYTKEELNDNRKFKNFMAEIIQHLLKEQLLENEQNIKTNTQKSL